MGEVKEDQPLRMGRELNHVSPEAAKAQGISLWCRYYVECELFNRRSCRMRDSEGNAKPMFARERDAVSRNAKSIMKSLGLSLDAHKKERIEVQRWPLKQQMGYLEHLANVRDKIITSTVDRFKTRE